MAKGTKRPQPPIPVILHPEAEAELLEMDPATQASVAVVIAKLDGKTHQEIISLLDNRTEPKIAQWERSHRGGTLRIMFAWGKDVLWYIGAFVKVNNAEGERKMPRIRSRADDVRGRGV